LILLSLIVSSFPKHPVQPAGAGFSTVWKNNFHSVENFTKVFPLCGKIAQSFSIAWKNPRNFFHSVEKSSRFFPQCGKLFIPPGRNFPQGGKTRGHFSTVWKKGQNKPLRADLALVHGRGAVLGCGARRQGGGVSGDYGSG
jgi:hypothetical protein